MPNPATTERPTIELPREPGESARAYAARVEYVTMGPGRSIDKVADQRGSKSGSRSTMHLDWSSKYGWVESARRYDEQVAFLTVQEAATAYRASLVDYRKRYGEMGKALYGTAAKLVKKINAMLDGVDVVNPGSLLTAINAAKTAADLEALALRLEDLIPKLADDIDRQ